jgi:magnesium transporter
MSSFEIFEYNNFHFNYSQEKQPNKEIEMPEPSEGVFQWINFNDRKSKDLEKWLLEKVFVNTIVLETIQDNKSRARLNDWNEFLSLTVKFFSIEQDKNNSSLIKPQQITFLLFSNRLISIQESESRLFDTARKRIIENKGRVRKMPVAYLLHLLLDAIIDNYFAILEFFGDELDNLSTELELKPSHENFQKIQDLRNDINQLRKVITPFQQVVLGLIRDEIDFVGDELTPFLQGLYDHAEQAAEATETLKDELMSVADTYFARLNNRLNETIRFLTIISTFFIPLTFLCGVYGMNFEFMPELAYKWSYPILMAIMALICLVLMIFFKNKKWL